MTSESMNAPFSTNQTKKQSDSGRTTKYVGGKLTDKQSPNIQRVTYILNSMSNYKLLRVLPQAHSS